MDITQTIDGFEVTACGLASTPASFSEENFYQLYKTVAGMARASSWLIGDTLNLAERKWGNQYSGSKYAEAEKLTGLSTQSLKRLSSVCARIPYAQRLQDLSFEHHAAAIATADSSEECQELLSSAVETKPSVKAFRKELRQVKMQKVRATMHEDSDENFDRPFGITDISDNANAPTYPLAIEITRISAWFEDRNLRKIPATQRKEMLIDLTHIIRDAYILFQLELAANPEASWDLPFEVKS